MQVAYLYALHNFMYCISAAHCITAMHCRQHLIFALSRVYPVFVGGAIWIDRFANLGLSIRQIISLAILIRQSLISVFLIQYINFGTQ